ncbi:hypothetical protein BDN71DRAFT_1433338 [Pleurotus eryngii]|uniref:Uncharacterized protein n=1 Tax=Pleurotus eryngii TaxID=5323 RepID=A0A9P6D4J3_PLEER|nr:hypothetical protein BDN71DRAFT_1433338 [Pleurotus eryngii]
MTNIRAETDRGPHQDTPSSPAEELSPAYMDSTTCGPSTRNQKDKLTSTIMAASRPVSSTNGSAIEGIASRPNSPRHANAGNENAPRGKANGSPLLYERGPPHTERNTPRGQANGSPSLYERGPPHTETIASKCVEEGGVDAE